MLEGLAPLAAAELESLGSRVARVDPTEIEATHDGDITDLDGLRLAVAVYEVVSFAVPRPKALLGDEHLRRLVTAAQRPASRATSGLRLGAAGADSPVMRRLAETVASRLDVPVAQRDGDLLIRLRPARGGWEALVRRTPRPLSTRLWRTERFPGALNATIAAAAIDLGAPRSAERVLNLACGSGTLAIERLHAALPQPAHVVASDSDPAALAIARVHVDRAGARHRVALCAADASSSPHPDASFDAVLADLPWGTLLGSHETNAALYPAVLTEAARVTREGGRFVLVSHEVRLTERALRATAASWTVERDVRVFAKGHHPHIWVLRRSTRAA